MPKFLLSEAYQKKFPQLIEACLQRGCEGVIVADPSVLGDTYEELCTSLRLIYSSGKVLRIATSEK